MDVPPLPGIADHRSGRAWLQAGDAVLAAAVLTLVVVEIWVIGDLDVPTINRVAATVVALGIAIPVALRTIIPWPAFLANSAATLTMVALSIESDFYQWANLMLLFSAAVATERWRAWLSLAVGELGVLFYFFRFRDLGLSTAVMVFALWLVVWLVGRFYRVRVEQDRLRMDRDLAAELAATRQERLELEAQRTTMARELHDLIGHTVNVMVVHAGAGRRAVKTDPDGAERAFETIETTGRSALDELDRVLGLLRDGDGDTPLAPLPGLAALPALMADMNRAGLDASLTTTGPIDEVSDVLGLTIYRVVQEALTNTMKHSDALSANTSIDVADGSIQVRVVDPGPTRVSPSPSSIGGSVNGRTGGQVVGRADGSDRRQGRGLSGIAERVQLHGGSAEFGSVTNGGFEVVCHLPLTRAEVAP